MSNFIDLVDELPDPSANFTYTINISDPIIQAITQFVADPTNHARIEQARYLTEWAHWLEVELCLNLSNSLGRSWKRQWDVWDRESRHEKPITLWSESQYGNVGIELRVPLFPLQPSVGSSLRGDIETFLRSLPHVPRDDGLNRRPHDLGQTCYKWLKFAYSTPNTRIYSVAMTQNIEQLKESWKYHSRRLSPETVCWTPVGMNGDIRFGAQWFLVWRCHEIGDESYLTRLIG